MRLDLPEGAGSGSGGDFTHAYNQTVSRTAEDIAGYILYRMNSGRVEYLLLKKPHELDWSPPKGHVEVGETFCEGAEREVLEETGFSQVDYEPLDKYPIHFEYRNRNHVLKKVHLWAAKTLNLARRVRLSSEHERYRWVSYEGTMTLIKWQYREAIMAADLVVRTYESL